MQVFFWRLSKIESLETTLLSIDAMVRILRWFKVWYFPKIKKIVPVDESHQECFLTKAYEKNQLIDTIFGAMMAVLSILRLSKHEKECEAKFSPGHHSVE